MSKTSVKINSILSGRGPSKYFASPGQFTVSIAIDPDFPIGTETQASGAIHPTVYEEFSGANITGFPKFLMSNPKNTLLYAYASDGKVVSYTSALGSETLVGTPTSGAGNGAAYYNNYIYFATPTDVSRYGPLNNSPSLTNTVWTGATLGTLTALTNTTYPSLRGTPIPNHAMHVHGDGSLYFCDFINGQGLIHRINTKKVTDEGDTNGTTVASAYNVLDLPFGYYPTDIESYGTDLAILAIRTVDATANQGSAALFFWDATSSSFYRQITLPDPLATALLYANGILYCWSGNASNGVRLSAYLGGEIVRQVAFLEEGTPPLAGAVDVIGNKIVFGGWTSYPEATACVYAYGSKNELLPKGLHNIVRTTSAGTTPTCTAVKFFQQADFITPQIVVGWGDDTAGAGGKGLDKLSTTGTYDAHYRSEVFNIGRPFNIESIIIPLGKAVAANMTITPKIFVDDDVTTGTSLTVINNTNFSGKKTIVYKSPSMKAIQAEHNFMLALEFTGTVSLPVLMPIEVTISVIEF